MISGRLWGARYERARIGPWVGSILFAALWLSEGSVSPGLAEERTSIMGSLSEVRDLVQDIEALSSLDDASVAKLFGTPLKRANDGGNPFIRTFQGTVSKHPLIRSIELRAPSEKNPGGGSLLILTVSQLSSLAIDEIRAAYGVSAQVEMPKAAAPMGTPTYESYARPWGTLTFGYLPANEDRVTQIIFDRK